VVRSDIDRDHNTVSGVALVLDPNALLSQPPLGESGVATKTTLGRSARDWVRRRDVGVVGVVVAGVDPEGGRRAGDGEVAGAGGGAVGVVTVMGPCLRLLGRSC
jgi:hypothetical protein